jgi:hypothetical protein
MTTATQPSGPDTEFREMALEMMDVLRERLASGRYRLLSHTHSTEPTEITKWDDKARAFMYSGLNTHSFEFIDAEVHP